jgi:hypothetical protein
MPPGAFWKLSSRDRALMTLYTLDFKKMEAIDSRKKR